MPTATGYETKIYNLLFLVTKFKKAIILFIFLQINIIFAALTEIIMKYSLFFLLVLLSYQCANDPKRKEVVDGIIATYMRPNEVPKHVGEDVEVQATIESTYFKERENPFPTYLDVSKNYEENPFAIIIPMAVRNQFPPHVTYRGKTVIITGRVETYDPWPYDDLVEKKPCIFLRSPSQIKIVK